MQENGNDEYSCAQIYNLQLDKDDATFHSKQDIQMHWTSELGGAEHMAWPFVPAGEFTAPWGQSEHSNRS